MSKVLHKKFGLSQLLQNNKVVLFISFILAIVVWAAVTVNSGNVKTRSIVVPLNVNLSNTYASQIGLKLTSEPATEVVVNVRGKWSVISKLTPDDLQVRADVSTIQKAGTQEVRILPSRNSVISDYDIVSCNPAAISIDCDYWTTNDIVLEIETPSLTAKGEEGVQLGTPMIDTKLVDNKVTVSGPQNIVSQIDHLVAKVTESKSISETTTFETVIQAQDKKNNIVSLDNCSFEQFDSTTVNVVVPVELSKEMTLGCIWNHTPKALGNDPFPLTIIPDTVQAVGSIDAMKALGDTLPITTLDFDNLQDELYQWEFPLKTDGSITIEGEEKIATVELDLRGYSTKTFAVPVSKSNVTISRNGQKKNVAIQEKTEEITLVGKAEDLETLTEKDISFTLDLGNTEAPGTSAYKARVNVKTDKAVWTYYGATGTGVSVYVTLS